MVMPETVCSGPADPAGCFWKEDAKTDGLYLVLHVGLGYSGDLLGSRELLLLLSCHKGPEEKSGIEKMPKVVGLVNAG